MSAEAPDEIWERQRALLGEDGQAAVRAGRVLVIGCGGLGAGAIPALAAAGVGHLTLMDDDVVAASNLNRQTLFTTGDIGRSKVELAAARVRALAPSTQVTALNRRLTPADAALLIGHDVVVDCTDRLASRRAISACCTAAGVPWVWAAVEGWTAVLSVFTPGGPRWEDVVGTTEDASAPPQVLGATPAVAGALAAAEVLKLIAGQGASLSGRLMVVDLLAADVRFVPLHR